MGKLNGRIALATGASKGISNDLSNVGAVNGMWSSAGQSFPTPAFLVDGTTSAPAPAPALSEFALVLLVVLLAFFGARSLQAVVK